MSRFLGCGCPHRPQYELQPTVWAGRHNEWRRIPEMTDEFNGILLSSRKWFRYSPFSFGTKPGLFVPSNVSLGNRFLRLTAKGEGVPDDAPEGYEKWTTSAVVSRTAKLYGYFETSFRASNSVLMSQFHLSGRDGEKMFEIKVFSYSASEVHRELVHMDAWYSEDKAGERRKAYPLTKMIFDMPGQPVTVGIDWTPDYLKTYVDGQEIRHLENRHWHSPMHICFSLELEGEKSVSPKQTKLEADEYFEIYYIRSWHRHPNDRHETSPGLDATSQN